MTRQPTRPSLHLKPGHAIRVRWRREEEFAFEPVSPAMVVTVRATLDDTSGPVDWTTEIWSGTQQRPRKRRKSSRGGGAARSAAAAAADISGSAGAGTRNGEPLYAIPAKRIVHHLIAETPVRTSALRGLGATANVFAIESFIDELAEKAGVDRVAYRMSILSDAAPAASSTRGADVRLAARGFRTGRGLGLAFARYKNCAAYTAVIAEVEVDEEIRLRRVWSATDAGLVVNPDGAINQLEGGILQAASWVLKEQVRLDSTGISARDWDNYPVLKFSEVPEIMISSSSRFGQSAAWRRRSDRWADRRRNRNAVAHALGARLRDLPLTRDRVMAAFLES